MKKPLATPPVFDPANRTLDFSATPGFDIRRLYGVTNIRTGQLIYSPIRPNLAPANLAGPVVTLSFDTNGMRPADPLFVAYDDGVNDLPPDAARASRQDIANAALAALEAGLGAPGDADPGSDGAAGSVLARLARLLTAATGLAGLLKAANATLEAIRAALDGATATADIAGTLAAGAGAAPVAADRARRFIAITNTGANPLAYRWGAAATATAGHVLAPGQSVRYDRAVPTAGLTLFSTNGTSFFITTG